MIELFRKQFEVNKERRSLKSIVQKYYLKLKAKISNVPSIFLNRNPYYNNCDIGDYTYGSTDGSPLLIYGNHEAKLRIGKFCSIGGNVIIFLGGSNHHTEWISTFPFGAFFKEAESHNNFGTRRLDVTIGHDVWIGTGATILSGVTIGNGAVIATQSVITKDVPAYTIVAGNPAKVVRKRFDEATIELLELQQWWTWDMSDILSNLNQILAIPTQDFLNQRYSKTEHKIIIDR